MIESSFSRSVSVLAAAAGLAGCFLPSLSGASAPAVRVGGSVFQLQGLVGVGRLPASTRDKYGETFGSFSAFTFRPGSWRRLDDGSYAGTLLAQPDRGYNAAGTTNYQPRYNVLDVSFRPSAAGASRQDQVRLSLADTVLYTDWQGRPFTSLDPIAAAPAPVSQAGLPALLPTAHNGRLSLDAEGIVANADGSLWVSDEYGPYVYRFSAEGRLLAALRPPEALIARRNGADSFASNNPGPGQTAPTPADPVTGRQNNQGLEGLSISPDGRTLFALLQSATRQDGGTGSSGPRQHTRLLAYDITGPSPVLTGHYVVTLPSYRNAAGATRVAAQSEALALNRHQLLVLARDGNGRGTATPTSDYRRVLLYDLRQATNLLGTAYESASTPVAPSGTLVPGVSAASGTPLVDLNDATELAKFSLANGPTDSVNNLSEKWEALALVPVLDPAAPDDYFLFVGNDNDFLTRQGFQNGEPYDAGLDNDNLILVYRLSLPSRLLNVSARGRLGAGEESLVVGFVVNGALPKTLLIRGVGPALAAFGVGNPSADPAIAVLDQQGALLASNDNWNDSPEAAAVSAAAVRCGAFALPNAGKDAGLLVTLNPGAYTVQLRAAGTPGVALAEVFELP